MRLISRSLKVLPVAAIVAGALASSAMAAPQSATCQFAGLTGSITPPVQTVGGAGDYTFSGPATCAVSEPSGQYTTAATINASGSFTNLVCGTGLAPGSASINFADPRGEDATATYSLAFAAAQGALVINTFSNANGTGSGAGYVNIVPSQGNCVTPVSQFSVTGAFTAAGA
jgi:hypothetical protein